MTRMILVGSLVVAAVAAGPRPAEALFWDWVQELSGPGPSSSGPGKNILATLCPADGTFNGRRYVSNSRIPCVFFDVRRFENEEDDNFPALVRTTIYDAGPTWEFWDHGQIELGLGAGIMHFSSNDVSANRFTITIVRAAVQPISLIPALAENRFAAAFKMYLRHTVIPGGLDATDFGVDLGTGPDQSTFSVDNDHVTSMGFIIDVGELLRGLF